MFIAFLAFCAFFLHFYSLRYHQLNPTYVHERLKQLGHTYELRVLLIQVDIVCRSGKYWLILLK